MKLNPSIKEVRRFEQTWKKNDRASYYRSAVCDLLSWNCCFVPICQWNFHVDKNTAYNSPPGTCRCDDRRLKKQNQRNTEWRRR